MAKPCSPEQIDEYRSSVSERELIGVAPTVQAESEEGNSHPKELNSVEIAHLLKTWPYPESQTDLRISGAVKTSRTGRLRRLYSLLRLLEKLEVVVKRVLPYADWMIPARMEDVDKLLADSVYLSLEKHSKLNTHDLQKTDLKLLLHP